MTQTEKFNSRLKKSAEMRKSSYPVNKEKIEEETVPITDSTQAEAEEAYKDLLLNIENGEKWNSWKAFDADLRCDIVSRELNLLDRDLKFIYSDEQLFVNSSVNKDWTVEGLLLDHYAPIPKGGKANVYAGPRSGKTRFVGSLLKQYKEQMESGYGVDHIFVVLCDERSEEATDFAEVNQAENITVVRCNRQATSSKNFRPMIKGMLSMVKEAAEDAQIMMMAGKDVLFIMDSLSRYVKLANLLGTGAPGTGGLYPEAMEALSSMVGIGHKVKDGGSLTSIFTMLDNEADKAAAILMDEGRSRGNCDIYLSSDLADAKIFPAILFGGSGKDEASATRNTDMMKNRPSSFDEECERFLYEYGGCAGVIRHFADLKREQLEKQSN